MATAVRFWVDPICPWCWTTSQWIRRIADEKDLEITWEPISLLIKNEVQSDSSSYERVAWTHGLLRVMESVRQTTTMGSAAAEIASDPNPPARPLRELAKQDPIVAYADEPLRLVV